MHEDAGASCRRYQRALAAIIVVRKVADRGEAGTKMLVLEDGRIIGTIGGGCAEAGEQLRKRVIVHAGRSKVPLNMWI
ncbi:MAG: XdhC family protein [Coprococcus sp.]